MKKSLFLTTIAIALSAANARAQTVFNVYDNTGNGSGSTVIAGYSEPAINSPFFGDALNLNRAGTLQTFGASVFNSTGGGNTSPILTATDTITIYDNTVPYSGGTLSNPVIATFNVSLNFPTGLNPGFFTIYQSNVASMNIFVPVN